MDLQRILDKLDKVSDTVIALTNEVGNLCKRLERIEEDYRHKDLCDQKHAAIDETFRKVNKHIEDGKSKKDTIAASIITGLVLACAYVILRALGVY